jgi:hypothetical protein
MTSLIKIIRTINGRMLINLSKVSVIEVKDNYIEYTFDSKIHGITTQFTISDTSETAKKEFDEIIKVMTKFYKKP